MFVLSLSRDGVYRHSVLLHASFVFQVLARWGFYGVLFFFFSFLFLSLLSSASAVLNTMNAINDSGSKGGRKFSFLIWVS